ncbi:MAG: J domain-containing protein [Cyanobium sp.]
MAEKGGEGSQRIAVTLATDLVEQIDRLKEELGLRSRGRVLEQLLEELLSVEREDGGEEAEAGAPFSPEGTTTESLGRGEIDEQAALVLVGRGSLEAPRGLTEPLELNAEPAESVPRGGGIELPGFVRRRSREIRRGLHPESGPSAAPVAPLPQLSATVAQQSLQEVRDHWLGLYGSEANAAVVEAAMVWLGRDIWPQSDQSEGRRFSWSEACRAMREVVPAWSDAPPSLERVIVTAGVLEDPFSAATLTVRIPTLIHRFMHRFRKRPQGTSFQTLEHTMTVQGALKLLQLPTDAGHAIALAQIREAYRERAMSHHPDAGGSVEAMRRLNEAYQLLKELYRQRDSTGR